MKFRRDKNPDFIADFLDFFLDFIADFLDFFKGNLKKSGLMDFFQILYLTLPKSPKITFLSLFEVTFKYLFC